MDTSDLIKQTVVDAKENSSKFHADLNEILRTDRSAKTMTNLINALGADSVSSGVLAKTKSEQEDIRRLFLSVMPDLRTRGEADPNAKDLALLSQAVEQNPAVKNILGDFNLVNEAGGERVAQMSIKPEDLKIAEMTDKLVKSTPPDLNGLYEHLQMLGKIDRENAELGHKTLHWFDAFSQIATEVQKSGLTLTTGTEEIGTSSNSRLHRTFQLKRGDTVLADTGRQAMDPRIVRH
jgi:hypothetical protein